MAKNFDLLFYASAFCAVLVPDCMCDKDLLEFATVWDEEPEAEGNLEAKNWTESIDRNLYLSPPVSNAASKGGALHATVKNVDEAISRIKEASDGAVKTDNIQRVAKKMNFVHTRIAQERKLENGSLYSNGSRSDVIWLARVLNVAVWDPERIPGVDRVSSGCKSHLAQYLKALHDGTLWATKVSDATGRYTSQFFFGNDFWLGSKTMCLELQNKYYNKDRPPFPIHFFVTRFILYMQHRTRLVSMGFCLPKECSREDMKTIFESDAELIKISSPVHFIKILSVRVVPGLYSLWSDGKLHLLLTILISVTLLTIVGSIYEISLERKHQQRAYKNHQVSIMSNNNNGVLKIMRSLEIQMQNDYSLDNSNIDSSSDTQPTYNGGESIISQFVLAFSALSNSRKILNVGPAPEESLTCVHGLRFLSLLWVIMVHTYLQVFTIAENKDLRTLAENKFLFQTVSNATFSVDTFFFISGLLVTYLYFKSAAKDDERERRNVSSGCTISIQKFMKLVGYRYLRLTPAYMFVLLIAEISMRWIHDNSVFEPQSQNHVSCDKYWWRNILYINSLYPMKDMCMLWSWYVSNDTQFYVLGILILLFSVKYFKFSLALIFFFTVTSWIITISISLIYDFRARIDDPFMLFDELYDKPWTRLGPYLIGMCAGWFIFKSKCKIRLSKFTMALFWFCSIFTLLALVYGLHLYSLGAVGSSLYVSVGHTAWSVALAWIVIACCSGCGGFVDTFLSYKLIHPLSRLTYCAYLMHPIIMTTTNFQMNAPLHLQDSIVLILYFGNTLASFVSSFCVSLLFEAPVVRLLKLIFSPKSKRKRVCENQTNL